MVEPFRNLFERIVWQVVEAGLVDGSKIFVDLSMVDADASNNSVVDTQKVHLRENYKKLEARLEATRENDNSSREYVKKNNRYISTTDPDAGDEIQEYVLQLGHAVIDAGADVVFGHHSHRPLGVEVYKGKPIYYSLGNFLYHRTGMERYLGPEQTIGRVKLINGKITKIEVIPTIDDNLCVSLADLKLRDKTLEYLKQFEKRNKFGTKFSVYDEEIAIEVSS